MKNQKSAKDIAFDRERAKLKSEIRKTNEALAEERNAHLKDNEEKGKRIAELESQVAILTDAMEKAGALKEDIAYYLQHQNKMAKSAEDFMSIFNVFGNGLRY